MKKIISLVLVALLIGTVAYAAQPLASPGEGDIMGAGQFPSDPGKIFRLVRYMPALGTMDSETLTAESIMIWDLNSDDGVTITESTTSYDSAVAGITAVQTLTSGTVTACGRTAVLDIGAPNWTWLQTYGKAEVRVQTTSGTVTAGDAMSCGSIAGMACDFLASATASGANGNAGFFYDTASAAETDVECFLICD